MMKWVSERRFLHFIEDIKKLFAYKNELPTKVSQLENDSKYARQNELPTKVSELDNDSKYASQSELPTKVSELDNDKGFITNVAKDLINYYLKSETYTREEVKQLVNTIPKFSILPVSKLPTEDISVTTVYLLTSGDESNNLYTEYIYVNGQWEKLGTQKLDLSGYALKTDIPVKLSELINDSGFVTGEYVDNLTSYKTLVDVTLDESNSGTTKVMAELPLEDFLRCNDFTIYVEMPIDSTMTESITFMGYFTNITESAYTLCVLYNFGTFSTTTGLPVKIFSHVRRITNGQWLSLTSGISSHTGANTSNTNVRSMMQNPFKWGAEDYPPYLRITINRYTFPSGTRIIVEGR